MRSSTQHMHKICVVINYLSFNFLMHLDGFFMHQIYVIINSTYASKRSCQFFIFFLYFLTMSNMKNREQMTHLDDNMLKARKTEQQIESNKNGGNYHNILYGKQGVFMTFKQPLTSPC